MDAVTLSTLTAALLLAGVHLSAGRIERLGHVPRSAWLSGGAGISVAYVFVHLMPELAAAQGHAAEGGVEVADGHVIYVVALAGLLSFYGLELLARRSRSSEEATPDWVGWVHVGFYAIYNGIVGELLWSRGEVGTTTLSLFTIAIGIHFLVNDRGLEEDHGDVYDGAGRWIVTGGILGGWLLGGLIELSEVTVGVLLAFLAGGIIMNVIKEELPAERRSRYVPLLAGAAGYTALLLLA